MKSKTSPLLILPVLAATLTGGGALAEQVDVYFGTYTRQDGAQGIYRAEFDEASGKLGEPSLAVEAANPSFLAIAPSGKTLYAVSEVADVDGGGAVSAYVPSLSRQASDGARVGDSSVKRKDLERLLPLELLNTQPSGGAHPCHVSLSPDGKTLAVANYSGGSVASYRIAEDGSLTEAVSLIRHEGSSVNPDRQKGPHAHSINFSADGRFAYAADLGTDRIYIYALDAATGALSLAGETAVAPGSGPRHFTFHPGGKFAYLINELTLTMFAFTVDGDSGALTEIQSISTLPEGTEPVGSTAEVVCHPSGKFLYGSNRGHDSIVVYQIDPESGKLTYVENEPVRGKTPRNFAISPSGKWLLAAGQQSGNVTIFSIDQETGALEYSGSEIKLDNPVCIRFLPRQ